MTVPGCPVPPSCTHPVRLGLRPLSINLPPTFAEPCEETEEWQSGFHHIYVWQTHLGCCGGQ